MTPTEITAHALELGITPDLYPEWFDAKCPECGQLEHDPAGWYEADTGCAGCNFLCCGDFEGPPLEWICTLPAPDSDDPRACMWDGFYMRALGWPNLGNYDDFYECLVACGDMMLSSHRGPTPTAALRAAWLAKGASK